MNPLCRVLLAVLSTLTLLGAAPAFAEADAARQAMTGGNYRQAASMLGTEASRAASDPVSGPHLRYLQGRALQLAEDHRGAVRAFDRLLKDFPESSWVRKARFCRADSLAALGDVEAAATTYGQETDLLLRTERRDELAQVFLEYAMVAYEPEDKKTSPDYQTARALFATVLQLEPSEQVRSRAEHYRACCYIELGDPHSAVQVLATRLDDPENPMAAQDRYQLGRAQARLDAGEAVRQFHLLARTFPEDPHAADALWEAAQIQAPDHTSTALDPDRAVEDLEALVAGYPDHEKAAEAQLRVARVLEWNGRLEPATEAFRAFIDDPRRSQHEDRPQALVELARLLERMGQDDRALEVYREYAAAYPTHAEWPQIQIHLSAREQRVAKERIRVGDLDGAVEALRRHAEAHPAEDAEARYLIGLTRYRQGRIDEAVEAFEAVASKFPFHWAGSRAEYALARIYLEERRDVAAAREQLESCLEHGGQRYGDCSTLFAELETEGLDLYVDRPLRSDERPQVWLSVRNLEQVELTVHSVDPEILMRKEGSIEAMESLDVELIEPDRRWRETIEGATDGLSWSGALDMPQRAPGVYAVGATGKTMHAQIQVVISDITLAVHRQGGDVLVYVQDRRRGTPVSGARVLLSDGSSVFHEGKTGGDGVFLYQQVPGEDPTPQTVVALALKGGSMATATVEGNSFPLQEDLNGTSYIYTERSAYRPGATVGYRGIFRRQADRRYENLAGKRVRVRLLSPQGWMLASRQVELDRFGAVGGEFELEPSYGVGMYRVAMDLVAGDVAMISPNSASFQVTEAAPSRRQVAIEFDRPVYVVGDEVHATVKASTYTGAPLVGVRLNYSWGHETEGGQSPPTDDEGQVTLSTTTLNHGGLHSVQLSASLPGEPVVERAAVGVRDAEFALTMELDRDKLRPGEAMHATLKAMDAEGEGIVVPLDVALYHTPTNTPVKTWQGNPFTTPLWEEAIERELIPPHSPPAEPTRFTTVNTAADGRASSSWTLATPGNYRLVVTGRDARQHTVRAESSVTVLGDPGEMEGLALLAEETHLSANDTAHVRVLGAGAGSVLTILDADGIAYTRSSKLREEGAEVTAPLGITLAPAARLTVVAVRGDRVLSGQIDLTIAGELHIDVEGLPERAAPGDQVQASIRLTDESGQPVVGQVSVAVVDSSLLAQFPESRTDADGHFLPAPHDLIASTAGAVELRSVGYGAEIDAAILAEMRRMEESRKRSSKAEAIRPEDIDMYAEMEEDYWFDDDMGMGGLGTVGYGAGGGASGYGSGAGGLGTRGYGRGGGGGMAAQVSRFRSEAALWIPDLVTGSDGVARFTIPLPAHAASWQVIAVAVDEGLRSGDATESFISRAPLTVAIAPPTFVRAGDAPSMVADLIADDGGTFDLEGAIGGQPLQGERLELVPGRLRSFVAVGSPVTLDATVRDENGSPAIPFELSLVAGEASGQDRLSSRLVVADRPLERWRAGRLERAGELLLQAPEGAGEALQYVIELAPGNLPGALAIALTGSSRCSSSPYVHANLAFASTALLDGASGRLPADQEELVRSLAREHVLALVEDRREYSQQWSNVSQWRERSLTAAGYVALVRGTRQGLLPSVALDQARGKASQARNQLLNELRDTSRGQAYQAQLLYALSFQEGDDAQWSTALTRLLRTASADDPTTLGRLVTAAVQFGMREDAADLVGELENGLTQAMASGDHLAMAATAEGLAALKPGHPQLTDAAVALEERLRSPWLPAHTTAALVAALARLQGAGSSSVPVAVRVTLPDGSVQRVEFAGSSRAVRLEGAVTGGQQARVYLEPVGRGPVRYRAALVGEPAEGTPPPDDERLSIRRQYRRPDLHLHGVPLPQGFSSLSGSYSSWTDELVALPVGHESRAELRIEYGHGQHRDPSGSVWILEEFIPAGTTVVPGSVSGVLHAEVHTDRIVAYLDGSRSSNWVRYTLSGTVAGSYTAPGAILRRLDDGQVFEHGPMGRVQVSPTSIASQDPAAIAGIDYPAEPFRVTPDELYELGLRLAKEERWEDAAGTLTALLEMGTLQTNHAKQVASNLLQATVELGDREATLHAFEMLKERDPAYLIPFEQIVAVAHAYEGIGEHRQAIRVYRSTLGARFQVESSLGATLERENLVLPSLRFGYDLALAYPDLSQVQSSMFHLPQIWANWADLAETEPSLKARGLNRETLLVTSADWMLEFTARFPESPLVEEAGLQLASTHLELEDNERAIAISRVFSRRFPEGQFLDSFLYVEGHARRARGEMPAAQQLLERVANEQFHQPGTAALSTSAQRPLALYSIAQIYEAQGRMERAKEHYEEVAGRFRDAAEAVAQMERVVLQAEQVTSLATSARPSLALAARNVPQLDLLLYRVDLMRLYLREKNLANVTSVRLAGIEPIHHQQLALAGNEFREQERDVALPLSKPGAYLVVLKGDAADLSAMVLYTDLELQVQEDRNAGRVRVTVTDPRGRPVEDAHIKIIGANTSHIASGDTDLRGVFAADGVHGIPTVIARKDEHYAFFSGESTAPPPPPMPSPSYGEVDLLQEIRDQNQTQRSKNRVSFDEAFYNADIQGVSVEQIELK